MPAAVPSICSQVNNGNGGASFVNLRGLGTNRNLVLLDGKRLVPAGLGGVVDLNNIPLSLLERLDVLTGGASTTYGADAVAGVVNFITKRDFAGADISVSQQITEEGDGNIFRADFAVGANFDDGRGNATFSVGYQEADAVYQGARDYSIFNVDTFTGGAGGFLRVLRTLRLVRTLGAMDQTRGPGRAPPGLPNLPGDALVAIANLLVFVFIMTGVVYETQHRTNPDSGNYADALYFTVTALTTTGFGDITLPGTLGRMLTVVVMIFGVTLFLRLAQVMFRPYKVRFGCPACGLQRHEHDAVHCKACGLLLAIPDDGEDG